MKKIFKEGEKFDPVLYSEQYMVDYNIIEPTTGLSNRKSIVYYAAGKNAHKEVEGKFKQDMKGKQFMILRVIYQ